MQGSGRSLGYSGFQLDNMDLCGHCQPRLVTLRLGILCMMKQKKFLRLSLVLFVNIPCFPSRS